MSTAFNYVAGAHLVHLEVHNVYVCLFSVLYGEEQLDTQISVQTTKRRYRNLEICKTPFVWWAVPDS